MLNSLKLLCLLSLLLFQPVLAVSPMSLDLTYPLIPKDPEKLTGYRIGLGYQPNAFNFPHYSVYFDATYGHWWIPNYMPHRSISLYSVAPVLRFYLMQRAFFAPFVEASIGLSYMSQTRFGYQNLGMHFSFQDQVSVGSTLGKKQQWAISVSAMHYSNGSLCNSNAGITIPLLINLRYRF